MKGKAQTTNELTRIEAYLLSEKAGHPSHMHDYFWSQAETIVRQRAAIVHPAVKTSLGRASEPVKSKAKAKPTAPKAKKTPDAQLPLGDVATPVKPAATSPKKPAVPAKTTPVVPSKATAKKASKPK